MTPPSSFRIRQSVRPPLLTLRKQKINRSLSLRSLPSTILCPCKRGVLAREGVRPLVHTSSGQSVDVLQQFIHSTGRMYGHTGDLLFEMLAENRFAGKARRAKRPSLSP